MRTYTFMAVILCVAGWTLCAQAESNGLGFYGGYWNAGDGESVAGPGVRLTAELFPEAVLDFRFSSFDGVVETDDGDLDVMPLDLGVTVFFPMTDVFSLHLGAGVGYYLASGLGADDEFGLNVLGGGEVRIKQSDANYGRVDIKLFAEMIYRSVDLDNPDGADVDGIGANAGLMINW